jgi:hypothetical protein
MWLVILVLDRLRVLPHASKAFRQGLLKTYRWAEGQLDRLRTLAGRCWLMPFDEFKRRESITLVGRAGDRADVIAHLRARDRCCR